MFGTITRWFLEIAMRSAIVSAVSLTLPFWANCAYAQITPDGTLPNNSIIAQDGSIFNITGGTQAGGNLFHSFQEFSVLNGRTASFNNGADIQNIISRVTGGSVSSIDGIIKANGTANLFLINPSGIIFGKDASLNIGGSFVATTASAIQFGNQGFFSASAPNNPELLTVNPSAFFYNRIAAASIQNNSVADASLNASSEFTVRGLRVPDGKNLLLVGGDIKIDGGVLYAFGGRVELGGLASAGTVGLNGDGNNLSLSFPNSVERSNVSLSNGATVAVIADDGGSITVNARNLEMTGGSLLGAGIASGLGSNNSKAGNIEVNATGAIKLNNSFIFNDVQAEASGQGGDISISASTLQVEGGAQVTATTFGSGKGGDLRVDAQNVQLISSALFATALPNSTGDAGNLTIKTNTLLVRNGAQVATGTFGSGKGGDLRVDAQDVQIIGESANGQFSSALSSSAQPNSTGDAGDLTIKTNTLLVRNGAQVATGTSGTGKGGSLTVNAQDVQLIGKSSHGQALSGLFTSAERNSTRGAGNLTIKTNTLLVRDGAQVFTGTFGSGKGGSLSVDAQDIQLIGKSANSQAPSGLFASAERNSTGDAGDLTIKTNTLLVKDGAQIGTFTFGSGKGGSLSVDAQDVQLIGASADGWVSSGLIAGTQGTGKAGDLSITTQRLLISSEALVTVNSRGEGTAGNLSITANSVRLDNGEISAQTNSGNGGNLRLNIVDLLLLRRSSKISTTAGTAQQPGDGGNITINVPSGFIVAAPRENSDITANAFSGSGGRVTINATGIYGIAPLTRQDLKRLRPNDLDPRLLKTSDITAISQQNPSLSGSIELITPDVDPTRGLVELPVNLVDASQQIAQGCTPRGRQSSSFVVTGRGGLPLNPREAFNNNDTVRVDWVTLSRGSDNRRSQTVTIKPSTATPKPIVEATGWVKNEKGEVQLTANAPTTTPHDSWLKPTNCNAIQSNK